VALVLGATAGRAFAAGDVVLYSTDFTTVRGNWSLAGSTTGAGGQQMGSVDNGWATTDSALANPSDYVEATFSAPAGTAYHVWVRLRATNDTKYNDSVWVQFSDAVSGGSRVHAIGTSAGLLLNLENCSGCGVAGWGWQDKAYWLQQANVVQFASDGAHTIRIQTREDGVQFDQVLLSPSTYMSTAPGQVSNDATVISRGGSAPTTTASAITSSSATTAAGPFSGSPTSLPGQVNAETFDNGGEGIGYHDTTSGNSGGRARTTDVDIESSSEGGYDVGWTAPGEWLNYTVDVGSSGNYTVQLRVASPAGGTMHVGFNGPSNVWRSVSIPATGGWQAWTTVSFPATLGAGRQQMTIQFDTGSVNLRYASVGSGGAGTTTASESAGTPAGPYSGTPVNIPGTIEAENFDFGGEGVSYHDTSAGNSGGAYRSNDVDIESASDGGYDVGWTAAGEWLNYTVNVTNGGNYTAQLRVASARGGTLHIGFNGPSSVWTSVNVPNTGGWQSWTTLSVPVSLGAGRQQMTVLWDNGGVNLSYVNVVAGSSSSPSSPPPPPPPPPSS
jgi:hypothetical protein